MSKHKSNVNPYYKTAGREPVGRDLAQEVHVQEYAQAKAREKRNEADGDARDSVPPQASETKDHDAPAPPPPAPRARRKKAA